MKILAITEDTIAEAKLNPGGHVFAIDNNQGPFDDTSFIPPGAIIGAWKVDDTGILTGEFISNPNYKILETNDCGDNRIILLGNKKFG